ncbi:MAG: DUF58 domain-containing protein [Pirellulaceae bacterium]|nr:DUF58 domain-containing protein [Pirellulaceae bacterium]
MESFDSNFLKQLEYLSLVSRRVFRGQLLAQRRTLQRGTGVEFADHRQYTPGDDFRYLDWNLYARHDELLLKRFQEEADLHVYLLLDCSRSMDFGQPNKFDYARRVTAALAYIALADLDRVSVVAFASNIVDVFPLARGKQRVLSLLKFLQSLRCRAERTDLERSIRSFVHRQQRLGLVILVSDLFDPGGFERGVDLLRHHGYEPHLVHLVAQQEAEPRLRGDVELEDLETGQTRRVTVTERHLRQYRQAFAEFLERVEAYCCRHGLGCTRTTTQVPFEELVLRMMRSAGAVR